MLQESLQIQTSYLNHQINQTLPSFSQINIMAEYTNNYSLSNELLSFKKSIASNNRQAVEKYLTQIKNIPQDFLNQAIFWCIENYKVETDQCLHLLIRYTSEIAKIKANLNCQINLQTPLISACKKGQLSLVKRLIQNGAKPDLTNSQNKHPLEFILTSRQENYDVADYLISQIQTVNFLIDHKHPILISVERQFHRVFKSLLEKGSEIMFEDGNLLHVIMKHKFRKLNKKKKMLKQLTSKHALFTQVDKNGKIPIEYEESEQIKAYYAQNFKIKKAPEPLITSVEKISNNSSIFINLKPTKKESRAIMNERKKNVTDTSQGGTKQLRDGNKETMKVAGKDSKEDDGSFEEEVEDKEDSENNEDEEKSNQKQIKINTQTGNLKQYKKSGFCTYKNNQNSSSISNNQKDQGSIGLNNSAKLKSKYSQIGPKTETYLKNYTPKRNNDKVNQFEIKKSSGASNLIVKADPLNIKKKKSSFEDEKKEVKSSQKINISELKTSPVKDQAHQKRRKYDQNEKTQKLDQQDKQNLKHESQNSTLIESTKQIEQFSTKQLKEIDTLIKNQAEQLVQKCESNEEIQPLKQSEEIINVETEKKRGWQLVLQSCQKLMEQFIIKEESEITHLNELKEKLDEIFSQYQQESPKYQNEIKFQETQKLQQNNLSNDHSQAQNSSRKNSKSLKQSMIIKSPQKALFEEISSIEMSCENSGKKRSDCIFEAIQLISKKVQTVMQLNRKQKIEVSIQTYGSRANGLQIQASDIDLLIVCNINSGVKDLMLELQRGGAFDCSEINEAKFLANTSMPIMKLSLNSSFQHMNIDLTFQVRGHTGLRCTSLIRQFIASQQLLKPLVVTLKTLLGHYGLCDTYTGGVGSYSLTLMTIALLQFTEIKKTPQNLGDIFLEFLLFYGFQMDYVCQAIIIHPPGFNEKPAFSIYQLPYSLDLAPKLIIYDPLNPVNNVGRATYRIVQLKKLFKIWYVKLRTELSGVKDGISRLMTMKDELLERTSII